jgi:hypothetical protein
MKKIVLLISVFLVLAGFALVSFIPSGSPAPLEDYTVYATWNDTECNCGNIDEKLLDIEVWDVNTIPNVMIDYAYDIDITNESQPYQHDGSASIIWNCQGCYEVRVKIEYFDNEGLCCDGAKTESCDGEDLINGDVTIPVTLD